MNKSQEAQLKKQLKAKAKVIKEKGCPDYINLTIAGVERLQEYLNKNENWTPRPEIQIEEKKVIPPADFFAIKGAKKLSELGAAVAALQGTGNWADWEMSLWSKNGECRIYMRDCSYTNPKERGYYLIKENGNVVTFVSQGSFPSLPPLPTVENDLVPSPKLSSTAKAMANLNAQFGKNGWTQADLDDELEREEYQ